MVATDAFVYLPEYVIGFFLPYALKNGRRETTFIKGSPMNGESCQPCFEFFDASFESLGNVPSTK